MQNVISKYKNGLLEQKVYYEERLIKADATILQQTKLIDFLQTKLDEITKKKKTLGDMLFSSKNKENIDQRVKLYFIFLFIVWLLRINLSRKLNYY